LSTAGATLTDVRPSNLPLVAAGGMLGAAALHVAWGRGSSFPAPDRATLAEAVIGVQPGAGPSGGPGVPGPAACYAVAAALTIGAGAITIPSPVRRKAAVAVVGALSLRGGVGLAGRMPQDARSDTFRRWNRRLYSPLCLTLAALSVPAIRSR
jgi:hypothetical protein